MPHDTALQKFSKRSDVTAIAGKIIAKIGQAALCEQEDQGMIAIDSTGLEPTTASALYISRSSRRGKSDVKHSLGIVCGSLPPLAAVSDIGPNHDKCQVGLLEKSFHAAGRYLPSKLLADAGYDGEWGHQACQEKWNLEIWIKPVVHRKDGTLGGIDRSKMTLEGLEQAGCGSDGLSNPSSVG